MDNQNPEIKTDYEPTMADFAAAAVEHAAGEVKGHVKEAQKEVKKLNIRMVVAGILLILVGVICCAMPSETALKTIGIIVGAGFIVSGITDIFEYMELRRFYNNNGWLVFVALASIAFGVLLIVYPLVAGVAYTWVFGIGTILVGIACFLFSYMLGGLGARSWWMPVVMLAPVSGHAWSCLHHFSGGKCIAVIFGELLALMWITPVGLVLAGLFILLSTIARVNPHRRRSLIAIGCFLPAAMAMEWSLGQLPLGVGCASVSAVALIKLALDQGMKQNRFAPKPEKQ